MPEKVNNKKIVFLASYPKSGNTWLRIFLDAYFMGDVELNDIATSISDIRPSNLTGDVLQKDISEQIPHRLETLEHYIDIHESANTGIPLFIKTHNGNYLVNDYELIPSHLTKAVIYLVRDPKDVLPSFAKHTGKSIDATLKAMRNKHMCLDNPDVLHSYLSSWNDHVSSYMDADKIDVCIVKYEQLKVSPVTEFTRILKHIGIEPRAERVKSAVELTDLSRLQSLEKQDGFKEASKHQDAGFFGKKKNKLTLQQLNKVTTAFKDVIRKLDYFKQRAA